MSKKVFEVQVHLPNGSYVDDGLQSWVTSIIEQYGRTTGQETPRLQVIVEVLEP